ncbi:MAG TPA: ABC transporter substrate-binding protein, partial [Fimbriimonadaceae bacterium]|nr:ABC transporter substrate-binding protein [Fimbriimonadaceae bacterium]
AGRAKEITGITVVDPYTLRIETDKPRPYFLGKLTYSVNAVLPKGTPATEIRDVAGMIGTGPFKAEKHVPDQVTVLAANKEYHEGAPLLERLEVLVIKDAQARLNKYQAGEVDLVTLERSQIAGAREDPKLSKELSFDERAGFTYFTLSLSQYKPFKDVRVRRALAMSLDVDKIVNQYLGGNNRPAHGTVPPGVPGFREQTNHLKFDPAAARKLLAEAGYPGSKGLPPLELSFREQTPEVRIVAEAAASMWKEHLNFDVKLRTLEWRTLLERRNAGQIPLLYWGWVADYLDPENFLSFLFATYPYAPENRSGYSNPQFDALCREADSIFDQERRLELYAKAEDILLQDAGCIPVYFQRNADLVKPYVKGLRRTLFGYMPHTKVTLER